ncbi:MAG TPA: restriction endonuclease [Herpetosiphonaceae bacterium]|nr:restriction endonuclease [Herpetosiphonaceae bacterium]
MDETKTAETAAPAAKQPIAWRIVIIAGLLTGAAWAAILLAPLGQLQLAAGIAPVIGGIWLGRRVKDRGFTHGLLMSLFAVIAALIIFTPIILLTDFQSPMEAPAGAEVAAAAPTKADSFVKLLSLMLITLVPFPIYGVMLSSRNQKKMADFKQEMEKRGGQLQNPGRVINLDDLQAQPLPKFAKWVQMLFRKNGFTLDDYKFGKDVIDLYLTRTASDEKWLVRCSVADAVKPGMAQLLAQDLRDSEWSKGVLATSVGVQDAARKWAKTRRNIELLDGETLIEMNG